MKGVLTVPDRYALFGLIATEQDYNTQRVSLEQQRTEGETLIYETNDPDEARAIWVAGGYTDGNGVWHVVTRVLDRGIGQDLEHPQETERKGALRKSDYA
jgi:hypothetical protein